MYFTQTFTCSGFSPMLRGCGLPEALAGAAVDMGQVPTAATSPSPPALLNQVTWLPHGFPDHPTKEAGAHSCYALGVLHL